MSARSTGNNDELVKAEALKLWKQVFGKIKADHPGGRRFADGSVKTSRGRIHISVEAMVFASRSYGSGWTDFVEEGQNGTVRGRIVLR